ncbi:MAG TPA: glutathionylspermidine synthase family protein [Terriglobia bacterium]|nr:glutathionylspermidine synthase family protein [Terriglobia bacterium]
MSMLGVCDRLPTATGQGIHPLRAGSQLKPAEFSLIRRQLLLRHCKWDPQVGDVSTLATFPLLIKKSRWSELETFAEQLTSELFEAEHELLGREDLYGLLAIPRSLRRVLRQARQARPTPCPARVMRFDFHWTKSGWQISEVNADVPGGFSEASEFTRLMAAAVTGTAVLGNPTELLVSRIAHAAARQPVALLAAPGFMEDLQVISYLARSLHERGTQAWLARPQQLEWRQDLAFLDGCPVGAIVRFYQSEWLAQLPRRCLWPRLFVGGRTPVSNPVHCIFGESKRFPLAWNLIRTELPTWQRLLPETRDPREAPWRKDESWLIKTAWCNTGDTVSARGWIEAREWRRAFWSATLTPGQWIAQHRFEPVPVESPIGSVYPCIGVYTIDGRACGAYSRISTTRVVDHRAIDVALLLTENDDGS